MPSTVPAALVSSRYYPGFLAALFIILLRVAIGWHFLTEGLEKVESTHTSKPFSAEIYLRNAAGPLATEFRKMLPDADGKELLDADALRASWARTVDAIAGHYKFTDEQKAKAKTLLDQANAWSEVWFHAFDNVEARKKYLTELDGVEQTELNKDALSYEKERAWESRKTLEADRRKLTEPVVSRTQALADAVLALKSPEQQAASGNYSAPAKFLDVANFLTIYGLVAIGVCMIAGLLTPFASLSAALFLGLLYCSIPPFHGLPPNPRAEGHYWIVNKNLVELLGCLVVATTASGHWLGLDAVIFGPWRRRRWARYERKLAGRYGIPVIDKSTGRVYEPHDLADRS